MGKGRKTKPKNGTWKKGNNIEWECNVMLDEALLLPRKIYKHIQMQNNRHVDVT